MSSHQHVHHDSTGLSDVQKQHWLNYIGYSAVVFVLLVLLYMVSHWTP